MSDKEEFGEVRRTARRAVSMTGAADALSISVVEAIAVAAVTAIGRWLEPGADRARLLVAAAELIEQSGVDGDGVRAGAGPVPPDPLYSVLMSDDELALDVVMLGPLAEDDGGMREFPSLRAFSEASGDECARLALAAYRAGAQAVDRATFTALAWLAASGLRALADETIPESR